MRSTDLKSSTREQEESPQMGGCDCTDDAQECHLASPLDGFLAIGNDSVGSSLKVVDKGIACSSAIRYALHLRFLCPFSRKCSKSSQRCKSNPLSAPHGNLADTQEERRFYLYNDLRVVFPQRHSDSDEGKVCGISSSRVRPHYICPGLMRLGDVLPPRINEVQPPNPR